MLPTSVPLALPVPCDQCRSFAVRHYDGLAPDAPETLHPPEKRLPQLIGSRLAGCYNNVIDFRFARARLHAFELLILR